MMAYVQQSMKEDYRVVRSYNNFPNQLVNSYTKQNRISPTPLESFCTQDPNWNFQFLFRIVFSFKKFGF